MQEEEPEECALLRTPEREGFLASDDLKRPEDAKREIRVPLRTSIVGLRFAIRRIHRSVCSTYSSRLAAVSPNAGS